MSCGFHNKILRVDLSSRELTVEQPGEFFFRTYVGGWGLIAYYLLKEVGPGTDALGPDNLLIFAPGVVTGTSIGGSGRHAVGAKSPLTSGFGAAEAGGFWGAELKHAGWDAIIVTGQAQGPVYLWIKDDQVEIRDAAHLWGKGTAEVEEIVKQELGDKRVKVTQCGLAGENQVPFACVLNDVNRAAGRTGLGAVMGSKKLRAIAVRGTGRVEVADQDKVHQVDSWLREHYKDGWLAGLHEHGTAGSLTAFSAMGNLPTRNFQTSSFERAEKITGATMTATMLEGRDTCFNCPIACKRRVKVSGRYQVDPVYGGPEYETVAAFGSCCDIDDLEAIAYANQLCAAYGLDTISTGVTIAWAMECFERGLLTKEDTSGLEVRFGDAPVMITLVEQIAHRQGFGALLAEGSRRAAERIGRGTEKYAVQVKGQEAPMHEPRIKFGHGLGYATSPTGADHMHNIHDNNYAVEGKTLQEVRILGFLEPLPANDLGPGKARLAKYHINWRGFVNCVGLCMTMPYTKQLMTDLVEGVTGWKTSIFELMKVGDRAMAMARAFNYRQGLTPKDDALPWRFYTPLESGPAKGVKLSAEDMAKAIEFYYGVQGWDKETGAPTEGQLHELGVSWVAELLYPDEAVARRT